MPAMTAHWRANKETGMTQQINPFLKGSLPVKSSAPRNVIPDKPTARNDLPVNTEHPVARFQVSNDLTPAGAVIPVFCTAGGLCGDAHKAPGQSGADRSSRTGASRGSTPECNRLNDENRPDENPPAGYLCHHQNRVHRYVA